VTLRVTVWNEFRHEKQNEQIGAIYPDGMHTAIANRLGKETDFEVRTATLDEVFAALTARGGAVRSDAAHTVAARDGAGA